MVVCVTFKIVFYRSNYLGNYEYFIPNPEYRNFKTKQEICELIQPSHESLKVVTDWLDTFKLTYKADCDAIFVPRVTVEQVETMFSTQIYTYLNEDTVDVWAIDRVFGAASIPPQIMDQIDFVEGLGEFPMPRERVKMRKNHTSYQDFAAPQSLASLYNYSVDHFEQGPNMTVQAPAEFQSDAAFSYDDLHKFWQGVGLAANGVCKIIGPFDDSYADGEATLDIQWLMATGFGATNWYYTTTGWMYSYAQQINSMDDIPNVMTMSWGWSESQQCDQTDPQVCNHLGIDSAQYVARVNTEFQKFGVRGMSLFASSGDSGANGRSDSGCSDDTFHATFPGASPWLTSVGATEITPGSAKYGFKDVPICDSDHPTDGQFHCVVTAEERAVSIGTSSFTSGGGFSNVTAQPSYQKTAIAAYLKDHVQPPASMFNASGRGYPDVAALGNNMLILLNGEWQGAGGTSASCPAWGGIMGRLINIALESDGKPLGFLNPLLYQLWAKDKSTFNDVTAGDNFCTEDGCDGCKGFNATKG